MTLSDSYESLIKQHVALSDRIRNLESRPMMAVREKARIKELDKKRWEIHRKLEELAIEAGMSELDVRMDIIQAGYGENRVNIPGFKALPVVQKKPGKLVTPDLYYPREENKNEQCGVLLVFDESFIVRGWEGEGTDVGNSPKFQEWLQDKVAKLFAQIKKNVNKNICIERVVEDMSGTVHVEETVFKGLYVSENDIERTMQWIQEHPEHWVSQDEINENKETEAKIAYHGYSTRGIGNLSRYLKKDYPAFQQALQDFFDGKRAFSQYVERHLRKEQGDSIKLSGSYYTSSESYYMSLFIKQDEIRVELKEYVDTNLELVLEGDSVTDFIKIIKQQTKEVVENKEEFRRQMNREAEFDKMEDEGLEIEQRLAKRRGGKK